MKTSERTGAALDWAVAKCEQRAGANISEGYAGSLLVVDDNGFGAPAAYSTNWAQGGPIIERERISIRPDTASPMFRAFVIRPPHGLTNRYIGPTPLIAAMRCYVASKLGDDVEGPEVIA